MSDPELARCNVLLSHKRQRDPSNKIHREIEHRRRLIPMRFLYVLIALAPISIIALVGAPGLLFVIGFLAFVVGIVVWQISFYRFRRSPICNAAQTFV
jgi:hypothetical protein